MNLRSFREERDALVDKGALLNDLVLPDYGKFNVMNLASIVGAVFGIKPLVQVKFPQDYLDDFAGHPKSCFSYLGWFGLPSTSVAHGPV